MQVREVMDSNVEERFEVFLSYNGEVLTVLRKDSYGTVE